MLPWCHARQFRTLGSHRLGRFGPEKITNSRRTYILAQRGRGSCSKSPKSWTKTAFLLGLSIQFSDYVMFFSTTAVLPPRPTNGEPSTDWRQRHSFGCVPPGAGSHVNPPVPPRSDSLGIARAGCRSRFSQLRRTQLICKFYCCMQGWEL